MATENLNQYRNGHSTLGSQAQYRPRTRRKPPKEEGLSNGLIILVIAIVVGCFAVLWPKYFHPMFFGGEPGPNHTYDPEKLFMEGPHGREYLRNKLKDGGGHPGVHPGTGDPNNKRASPPIRPAADSPGPGGRPMPNAGIHPGMHPGMHPGVRDTPAKEAGRGAIGYLMPIYTVAILILFVYTAMRLVFKKKPGEDEEDGDFPRRAPRKKQKTQMNQQPQVPKFDEDYYNKLIQEQQKKQEEEKKKQAKVKLEREKIEEIEKPGKKETTSSEETKVTQETSRERKPTAAEEFSKEIETVKKDQKDVEIMMLQARLEQTEATLQSLIGQMGVLTASLGAAGLVANKRNGGDVAEQFEETQENSEEEDSDDEDESNEDSQESDGENEEEEESSEVDSE